MRTISNPPIRAIRAAAIITSVLLSISAIGSRAGTSTPPTGLSAEGHDSRIDLVWDRISETDQDRFNIYRAEQAHGPWEKLNLRPHTIHVYSDFIGKNGITYYYRVKRWTDGTIAPTAAISVFPYTPEESMATLKHFYHEMGARLWGPFRFHNAFNLGADWVSPDLYRQDDRPRAFFNVAWGRVQRRPRKEEARIVG